MITGVVYTNNTTFIQYDNDKAITTDKLSFSQAFHFARINEIDFDYEIIDKNDEEDFSEYLQYQIGNCNNTNISNFFNLLEQNGIRKIIKNNLDVFGRKGTRNTISDIVNDYNNNVALYNIECYGTDTYIAKTLFKHLTIYNNSLSHQDAQIYTLLQLVKEDNYDLDIFLKIVTSFASNVPQNNVKDDISLIKQLKNDFNTSYSYSSEAIEDYITYLVNYGGDYNCQIVEAMNKCFDDIIAGKPFCDRNGLINELKNG